MAATQQFETDWLEMQQKYGSGIDSGEIDILPENEIDTSVTIPAAKFEQPYVEGGTNIFSSFRHVPMVTFLNVVRNMANAIKSTWDTWFGSDNTSGVQKEWADLKSDAQTATSQATTAAGQATAAATTATTAIEGANQAAQTARTAASNADTSRQQIEAQESTRQSNEATRQDNESTRQSNESSRSTAEQGRASAESGRVTAEQGRASAESGRVAAESGRVSAEQGRATQASSDHTRAENDHSATETAINGANNVNAMLGSSGGIVTLTVIDRNGTSTSKEVGFRIAMTCSSESDMKTRAAGLEDGQFVMIASQTEPENGRLYARARNQQLEEPKGFSFTADLSGAQGIKGDTPVMTASVDGIIYADGVELTRVVKNAVDTFNANEGTSSSTSGDGSRWGAYKAQEAQRNTDYNTAETNRDTLYSTAEGSRNSQYQTAESGRDSLYQTAESNRDTARQTAEGTSSSTAGDGTRWGAYKTEEASRQTAFETSQTQRNTTWTEWFSDTLATGVRKLWNDFWSNANSSWNTFFGTSTSTGVQGEWNTLKSNVESATTNANNAASNANEKATLANTKAGEADTAAGNANTKAGYAQDQGDYAKNMADHPSYIADGTVAHPGDVGYFYSWNYATQAYVKGALLSLDWDSMTPAQKEQLAEEILAAIGFDDVPTENSNNAVKSGGIYTALQGKQDTLTFATVQEVMAMFNELT